MCDLLKHVDAAAIPSLVVEPVVVGGIGLAAHDLVAVVEHVAEPKRTRRRIARAGGPFGQLVEFDKISVGSWGKYRGTLDLSTPVTEDGRIRTRLVASHEDKKSFFDRYERKRSGKARAGPRPGNTNTAITSSSLMPGWSTASPRHTRSTPPTPASSTSRTSEIARGWQLFLGATRFIAQDAAGKDINTERPRTLLRPFTAYQLPVDWHRLTIGGGVNWQSRAYYDGVGPNRESQEQGGYAITNLMARYQLSPDLSLQVNVNNVFDKKYQRAVNWHGQGIWGTPAEVMATLRYRF